MKFVIHYHLTEKDHFDFMLEEDDSLLTWRIEPHLFEDLKKGLAIESQQISSHRKEYLNYQGPISCGRGSVKLVDSGSCKKTGGNSLFLSGKIFHGNLNIQEMNSAHKIFIFSYKKLIL
jgi:hypothetical protein